MSTETFLIESNRKIAYAQTISAELNALINTTDSVPLSEHPNHEWLTYVENGIQMNIGDQISVEASMINTKGSPEETMEFSGGSNASEGDSFVDNVAELEYGFYITNNQQFNFNLPLFSHKLDYRTTEETYGGPALFDVTDLNIPSDLNPNGDFSPKAISYLNYDYFVKCYPAQSIEGFWSEMGTGPAFTPTFGILDGGDYSMPGTTPQTPRRVAPSISNPSIFMYERDQKRLYKYPSNYGGIYNTDNLTNQEMVTVKIPFEVPIGFNSPDTVGEYLTSQFHKRSGNANDWEENYVQPKTFNMLPPVTISSNDQTSVLSSRDSVAITDQSYKTVSTCTGDLLYGRAEGKWGASFFAEGEMKNALLQVRTGTGYKVSEGNTMFWKNMLSGDMNKADALQEWNKLRKGPQNTDNIQTALSIGYNTTIWSGGAYEYTPPPPSVQTIGDLGCCVSLIDELESDTTLDFTYVEGTARVKGTSTVIANCELLVMPPHTAVATNIIFSDKTYAIVNETLKRAQYQDSTENPPIYQAPSSNITNEISDNMAVDFQFGQSDDELCVGSAGLNYNMVNPHVAVYTTGRYPSGSSPLPNLPVKNSYQVLSWAKYDSTTGLFGGTCPRLIQKQVQTKADVNGHKIYSRWNDRFNPDSPLFELTLPPDTLFSFFDSKGRSFFSQVVGNDGNNYIPEISGDTSNYPGIAVLFYKVDTVPHPNLLDVPFIAFINKDAITPIGDGGVSIPCPMKNEMYGLSSSLSDNSYAKIATAQKTTNGEDFPTPYAGQNPYPTGKWEGQPNPTLGLVQAIYFYNCQPYSYMPFCYIGADNPLIKFDATYSRFTISSLHTATRVGNGIFQLPEITSNAQFADITLLMNSTEGMISNMNNDFKDAEAREYYSVPQAISPNPVISAQSGIGIMGMRIPTAKQIQSGYTTNSNFTGVIQSVTVNRPNLFNGTLFAKLGFNLEQIIPLFGEQNNEFNKFNFTQYIGLNGQGATSKQSNMVKPTTTNAFISGSLMLGVVTSNYKRPMENLGVLRENQVESNAVSDAIIALGLPSKLDYSYLVVYSDIIPNTKYYGGGGGGQNIPAVGYISRNYSTGDYFFAFATDWRYTVDKPYVLNHFKVDIRLPNGQPAPISDNSSIIFKITKPTILPSLPMIPQTSGKPPHETGEVKQ